MLAQRFAADNANMYNAWRARQNKEGPTNKPDPPALRLAARVVVNAQP